jgi:PleD family two-component response regulator
MKSSTQSRNQASPLQVLVVSAAVERAMATRRIVRDWPLNAPIEWVCTWQEAMRRAGEWPARLAIVDCSDGFPDGVALVQQLRGHPQQPDVLAFSDAIEPVDASQPVGDAWPWSALAPVLDEWLRVQRKPETTPA